jgi:hypothetical protein
LSPILTMGRWWMLVFGFGHGIWSVVDITPLRLQSLGVVREPRCGSRQRSPRYRHGSR